MRTQKTEYPYNVALDELEVFIEKNVVHDDVKKEFIKIINRSRERQTVPIRGIMNDFVKYTNKYELFTPYSDSESELIDNLMSFGG